MIDWLIFISIVMTALFLFGVYASIMSLNKEHSRIMKERKLNELTASLSDEDIMYPLTKSAKAETTKRTDQEAVNIPTGPIVKKYEDIVILSSQKLPDHTPDPMPTSNFNRLILNALSQKS